MTAMTAKLDHPLVTERYFFPRADRPTWEVRVPVDGAELSCASHRPHAGAPTVVLFHGNGEVVADYVPDYAELFAHAGLNTFFAEYRGYGGSSGTPSLVGMLGDVEAILDAVGAPDDELVVYGRSVGSIYAIEAAHRRPRVRALAIESGISSPLGRVLLRVTPGELGATIDELRAEASRWLDHEAKLRGYAGRVLVLHAASDDLVRPTEARENTSWAKNAELVLYERSDHNSIHAYNLPDIVVRVAALAGVS